MRLPTSDHTLSPPVIGLIAAVIVVLLVLAILALSGRGEAEVDLSGAAPTDGAVAEGSRPATGDPATTAGEGAVPSADASGTPGPSPTAAVTGTPSPPVPAGTPTVPFAAPDTGAAPPAPGTPDPASEGSDPADDASGDPAGAPPADGALAAGTCIDDDGRAFDTASVTAVDCAVAHTGEVFATTAVTLPADAAYPGADALERDTRGLCQGPAFQEYIGTPFDESALFAYALMPTEESWAAGDRAVACVVFDPRDLTVGSVRGSGR